MNLPLRKQTIVDEAANRLKEFGFFDSVIDNYQNGIISVSDVEQRGRTISNDMLPIIEQVEKGYNCTVYHVVYTKTDDDFLYHFITVSNDIAQWEEERSISKCFRPLVCSYSVIKKALSKPHSIRVQKSLERVLVQKI